MTPEQIAKPNTEAAHQMAVMAYCAMAKKWGFERAEFVCGNCSKPLHDKPVPELAWLHHINNGARHGSDAKARKIEGSKLKAMGVKAGVADLFLPVVRVHNPTHFHAGLYIEMKKPGKLSNTSPEQDEFAKFVQQQNYAYIVVDNWRKAVDNIRQYLEG